MCALAQHPTCSVMRIRGVPASVCGGGSCAPRRLSQDCRSCCISSISAASSGLRLSSRVTLRSTHALAAVCPELPLALVLPAVREELQRAP